MDYRYYSQISSGVYKRKSQHTQYLVMVAILFLIATWCFFRTAPRVDAYIVLVLFFIFVCNFINKMFGSVLIDLDNETLTQKSGMLATTKTTSIADIGEFHIDNRIYVLLLISSAYGVIHRSGKQERMLLGQHLMNRKATEDFLLETEKILGRR